MWLLDAAGTEYKCSWSCLVLQGSCCYGGVFGARRCVNIHNTYIEYTYIEYTYIEHGVIIIGVMR